MISINVLSLEQLLRRVGLFIASLISLICYLALRDSFENYIGILLTTMAMLALYSIAYISVRERILTCFRRIRNHTEALNSEDYNLTGKPAFINGVAFEAQQQLIELSNAMQANKSLYDQHVFLVYQLIEHFNVPIVILRKRQQLSYANNAYSEYKHQAWQSLRFASVKSLGLEYHDEQWQFSDPLVRQKWQIKHSEFVDQGQDHQLLVMIDLEATLRASQLKAWQQIIRVLGHEIRNSLTPITTLAQTLNKRLEKPSEQQAMTMISERCQHLQDFVARYASIQQQLKLNLAPFSARVLTSRLSSLYPQVEFTIEIHNDALYGDSAFLQQVFINLVKNAVEACNEQPHIHIDIKTVNDVSEISIKDNGHGIANPDNLFVPFYSTKQTGQGIGLCFCQNIIEQHKGRLTLTNNSDHGACATIVLPHGAYMSQVENNRSKNHESDASSDS